jgi:hypothetical protein
MSKVGDGAASEWKHLYEAAVLELDRTRLLRRIEEARHAILQCLASMDPEDRVHAEPLTNALQVLQDLRRIGSEDGKADLA